VTTTLIGKNNNSIKKGKKEKTHSKRLRHIKRGGRKKNTKEVEPLPSSQEKVVVYDKRSEKPGPVH